jgi:hypothetical protein
MNYVYVVLYLHAEDEESDVEWGVEVYDQRPKAVDGVCKFLSAAGYSDQEVAFDRCVMENHANDIVAHSLGASIHILAIEVQ